MGRSRIKNECLYCVTSLDVECKDRQKPILPTCLYIHSLCMRASKALASLRICGRLPEL